MLAYQHTIMANQTELQAHQQALERRMDKIENLMLQILKALQKERAISDGSSMISHLHFFL